MAHDSALNRAILLPLSPPPLPVLTAESASIDFMRTVSVLGYCLLPVVALAALAVFVDLRGPIGAGAGSPPARLGRRRRAARRHVPT
jgi:hypothetical protein